MAVNAGIAQDVIPNDGYISLVNPDGTAHTLKWIGVNRNGLTLNHPLGSDIINGMLYVVDIDTVRWFDMKTGEPRGSIPVAGVTRFNDLEVAADGTIYATQTGTTDHVVARLQDHAEGRGHRVGHRRAAEFAQRHRVRPKGNLVVVNIGTNAVLTFSPDGKLLTTEESTDAGNDGIVVLADGTKYVSSVRQGTIARIRPGRRPSDRRGIPTAASMTYDSKRHRLVIPMNDWNAITIVELGPK